MFQTANNYYLYSHDAHLVSLVNSIDQDTSFWIARNKKTFIDMMENGTESLSRIIPLYLARHIVASCDDYMAREDFYNRVTYKVLHQGIAG